MHEIPVEVRLRMLSGQVYAAAEIGMWYLNQDREIVYSTCPHEKEFLTFLKLGDTLDYLYSKVDGWERPVILSDELGLVWIGEHLFYDGNPSAVILMGPVFLTQTSAKVIENSLREREASIYLRRQMENFLSNVPVVLMPMMNQYAVMLHYAITQEIVVPGELYHQDKQNVFAIPEDEAVVVRRKVAADRSVNVERLLMKGIREGNTEFVLSLNKEVEYATELVSDTGDILRDAKNTVLVFDALCCRAAMEGGLPIKIAKQMEQKYIIELEKCVSITQLTKLNNKMIDEYITQVHQCQEQSGVSKEVLESCDYIKANILKELTVEEIAGHVGYTPYYFTKKFYAEQGIRVTEYINRAKIDYAKIALISTGKSIQEISDLLHFGTRNYFAKIFRDVVGMTPAAYRERMGKEEV